LNVKEEQRKEKEEERKEKEDEGQANDHLFYEWERIHLNMRQNER